MLAEEKAAVGAVIQRAAMVFGQTWTEGAPLPCRLNGVREKFAQCGVVVWVRFAARYVGQLMVLIEMSAYESFSR